MKKILILLLPVFVFGQFSGYIQPSGQFRLSDNSQLNLPVRIAEFNLNLPLNDFGEFEVKLNSNIEYRWKTNEHQFDLQEAYLMWYPSFGEVKLGKQIHSWGAVDGNNPTDNLNAYDYYYMFLPGTDRKLGSVSASAIVYAGDWQFEGIIIPKHTTNRMPFGEEDFPFELPKPPIIEDAENPLEYGIRFQTSIFESDFSVSYFNGHDRNFSILEKVNSGGQIYPTFGYRKTDVFGADFVSFVGDFTFRGELGYFITTNEIEELIAMDVTFDKLETDAEYLQFVFQTEWTAPLDILLNMQWLGNKTISVEGDYFDIVSGEILPLTAGNFQPGMGTPFAMFSDQSILFSAVGNLFDNSLEIAGSSMFNLSEKGMMFGLKADYSPIEDWKIELGINKFIGDENDSNNSFTKLEDFSQINIGLKYSF